MKYQQINALVPENEHFDESAAINEGMFLSVAHIDAIENALQNSGSVSESIQLELENARTELVQVNSDLELANETISNQQSTIDELNLKLEQWARKPTSVSGTIVTGAPDEDPEIQGSTKKLPRYDSKDHPANIAATHRRIK